MSDEVGATRPQPTVLPLRESRATKKQGRALFAVGLRGRTGSRSVPQDLVVVAKRSVSRHPRLDHPGRPTEHGASAAGGLRGSFSFLASLLASVCGCALSVSRPLAAAGPSVLCWLGWRTTHAASQQAQPQPACCRGSFDEDAGSLIDALWHACHCKAWYLLLMPAVPDSASSSSANHSRDVPVFGRHGWDRCDLQRDPPTARLGRRHGSAW